MPQRISVRLSDNEIALLNDRPGTTTSDKVRSLIKADRSRPFTEYGSSGMTRWGGFTRDEALRELRGKSGRIKFQEMRQNNPVIAACFFAIESYLREVTFFAEPASDNPEDKDAANFLDECKEDMSFSWDDELLFILVMLEQGFMPLEIVYKLRRGPNPKGYGGVKDPAKSQYDDGKVGWRKWAPRPPASLTSGNEWIRDEHGGLQGINQDQIGKDVQTVPIPIESLLLFRTTPAPDNNPEGWPLLRPMYTSYYTATNLQEIEAIGVERDLTGLPVMYLGKGTTKGTSGTSDYTIAKELVENIRWDEQAGVVVPHQKMNNEGEGVLLELIASPGTKSIDIDRIINRYERRMAMSVLAQFIMLGMEKTGSYSLSSTQSDVFSVALSAWANYIAQTISRHAVPRLFALNPTYANLEQLPKLTYSVVGKPDLEALAKYVNLLAGAMVLQPDDALEDYLREAAHLPPKQQTAALSEPAMQTNEPTGEELEEATGEDDLSKTNHDAGMVRREYGRWLSEIAPRIAGSDRKEVVLKAGLNALCERLGMTKVKVNLSKLRDGPEHDRRDSLIVAVARKLAHAIDGDIEDILSAGGSMMAKFNAVTEAERKAMQKALEDTRLEREILATLESNG